MRRLSLIVVALGEVSRSRIIKFASICALAAWAPTVARASLIDGSQLHISGDAQFGEVSTTWQCNLPGDGACVVPPAGHGDFAVSASTGSFAQYNGTFGLIADTNNALQPLNTPFSLANFITFDLNSDTTIELTFIPLGNDPVSTTCAGLQHCTPQESLLITPANPEGLSAYNLDGNLSGTALTFGVLGVVHQSAGSTADLNGVFTLEFVGLNPQQTLALFESGSNSTYSADLSLVATETPVPEPPSIFLSGIGMIALGWLNRVRRS
jgi:hypothetical protein